MEYRSLVRHRLGKKKCAGQPYMEAWKEMNEALVLQRLEEKYRRRFRTLYRLEDPFGEGLYLEVCPAEDGGAFERFHVQCRPAGETYAVRDDCYAVSVREQYEQMLEACCRPFFTDQRVYWNLWLNPVLREDEAQMTPEERIRLGNRMLGFFSLYVEGGSEGHPQRAEEYLRLLERNHMQCTIRLFLLEKGRLKGMDRSRNRELLQKTRRPDGIFCLDARTLLARLTTG